MQIEITFKKIVSRGLILIGAAVVLYGLYYLCAILYIGYVLSHNGNSPW